MGIFHRMLKIQSLEKATLSRDRGGRVPGQVPDPRRHEGYQLMMAKPPKLTAKMILADVEPKLTVSSVVSGLGMSPEDEQDWFEFLDEILVPGANRVESRGAFHARAREKGLDPTLRLALFRRVQQFTKDVLDHQEPERIEVIQIPDRKGRR
jgi:hypothetical protein